MEIGNLLQQQYPRNGTITLIKIIKKITVENMVCDICNINKTIIVNYCGCKKCRECNIMTCNCNLCNAVTYEDVSDVSEIKTIERERGRIIFWYVD